MNNNLLKLKYPIIQAPMLGVTTPLMVSKCLEFGIMGSLPIGGLSKKQSLELIKKTKQLTNNNNKFAVNLFVNQPNQIIKNQNDYIKMLNFLNNNEILIKNQLIPSNGLNLPNDVNQLELSTYHDQIDILIEEKIEIISFTFGILDNESIKKIKTSLPNSILIGTATSIKEALLLDNIDGIDMICCQGIEAGGHRGSFLINNNNNNQEFIDHVLNIEELPQITLMTLLNECLNQCKKPLIASGGISDKNTIDTYLSLNRKRIQYCQIGSLFIGSNESSACEYWKDKMINSTDTSSQLTRSFSGRFARGLKNQFIDLLESNFQSKSIHINIPPYPIQNELTKQIRQLAIKSNNGEFTNLWSGQNGFKTKKLPIKDLLNELI